MSQNTCTLMLFFSDITRVKQCGYAYLKLLREDDAASEAWQQQLGVDLSTSWHESWFNHSLKPRATHICVSFDTSSSEGPPLQLLQDLFAHGLQVAVLETFHSQVGERERLYFANGQRVGEARAFAARADIRALVLAELGAGSEDDAVESRPVAISRLIEQAREQEEEGKALVAGLMGLASVSRSSGVSLFALLKSFSVIRELGRGLLHALAFTIISLLLFKGTWLWLGLGLLLAIVLPLTYAVRALREFGEAERGAC